MSRAVDALSDENREIAAGWCVRISQGPLGAADRREFERWLAGDVRNAALFERTVAAWQAVDDQAAQPELIVMRGEALERIADANRRRWTRPRFSWRQLAAVAASVLLLIGMGMWWGLAPTAYETGIGERRVVTLTDGSAISLDAATRVEVRYSGDRRQLWLEAGRAKFSVAKDPLRPFSVQAGNRMIVATGTQFSVERLSGQVRVLLYEGRVSVLDTSAADGGPVPVRIGAKRQIAEQALLPGRELQIADRQAVARVAAVDPGRAVGWEAGLLEFADEPLGIAVERMNRYGRVKLRVAGARVGAIPISGQFDGGDEKAFVEGITAVFPVTATRGADGGIVFHAEGGKQD